MQKGNKTKVLSSGTLLSALTSVVCMGSMGAMGLAATATATATATAGMAGMGGAAAGGATHVAFVTQLLRSAGLEALTQIPDAVLRPLFIALLILGIAGAYLAYRAHRQIGPLILILLASLILYAGIYIVLSDPLYYLGLAMLLIGTVWNFLSPHSDRTRPWTFYHS